MATLAQPLHIQRLVVVFVVPFNPTLSSSALVALGRSNQFSLVDGLVNEPAGLLFLGFIPPIVGSLSLGLWRERTCPMAVSQVDPEAVLTPRLLAVLRFLEVGETFEWLRFLTSYADLHVVSS